MTKPAEPARSPTSTEMSAKAVKQPSGEGELGVRAPAKRTRAARATADASGKRPRARQGRPVDADSAATRQAIIDAATDAFGSRGYEGTSLQLIAELAGLAAPTLYHYFPSKAAIFTTVGDEVSREFRLRADAATSSVTAANLRIAGVLRALGDWFIERPEIASFIATYAAEVARNREVRRISPTERWTEPIEYYARFAREGLERGEIAPDVEPEAVAGLVQGLVYGLSALVAVSRAFGPPDRVIDAFVRTIEGSLFVEV